MAGGGASTFTALTDTPSAYTDQKNKVVAVKTDETGVEFIELPASGITANEAIYYAIAL